MSKTEDVYIIKRFDQTYYFGRWHHNETEIMDGVCIGLKGVEKWFKKCLGKEGKIISPTEAIYPLSDEYAGFRTKSTFTAEKVEVYR